MKRSGHTLFNVPEHSGTILFYVQEGSDFSAPERSWNFLFNVPERCRTFLFDFPERSGHSVFNDSTAASVVIIGYPSAPVTFYSMSQSAPGHFNFDVPEWSGK